MLVLKIEHYSKVGFSQIWSHIRISAGKVNNNFSYSSGGIYFLMVLTYQVTMLHCTLIMCFKSVTELL